MSKDSAQPTKRKSATEAKKAEASAPARKKVRTAVPPSSVTTEKKDIKEKKKKKEKEVPVVEEKKELKKSSSRKKSIDDVPAPKKKSSKEKECKTIEKPSKKKAVKNGTEDNTNRAGSAVRAVRGNKAIPEVKETKGTKRRKPEAAQDTGKERDLPKQDAGKSPKVCVSRTRKTKEDVVNAPTSGDTGKAKAAAAGRKKTERTVPAKEGSGRREVKERNTERPVEQVPAEQKQRRKRHKFVPTGELMGTVTIKERLKDVSDNPFLVDVVINDEIWRVSKCSVRGDTYIQGLDSNFLVNYYNPKLKHTR